MPTYTRKVTIQTFWTCKKCKTKNPGLEGAEDESLRCMSCGNQKSDEPYEMPEDVQAAPEVTDEHLLSFARAGENWTCPYCRCQERGVHGQCSNCGATTDKPPSPPTAPTAKAPATPDEEAPRKRFNAARYLRVALLLLGVIGVAWMLVWLFTPHEAIARVVAHNWTRTEHLRERETVSHEDWRGNLPAGSFDVSCERKKKGDEDCRPHDCRCRQESYECRCMGGDSYDCRCSTRRTNCHDNGNGSATCDEETVCDTCYTPKKCDTCEKRACDTCYDTCPVYDDWCTAQSYEWPIVNTKTNTGSDLRPAWPGLTAGVLQRLERSESYAVKLANSDDVWTYHPSNEGEYVRFAGHEGNLRISYTRAGTVSILGPAE